MKRYYVNFNTVKDTPLLGHKRVYLTDEADAEIAEKDERYINMFIQMEKAGVKIIKLKADVAEVMAMTNSNQLWEWQERNKGV